MSIIIHALTPTELAALAPTESSCVHLYKLGWDSVALAWEAAVAAVMDAVLLDLQSR